MYGWLVGEAALPDQQCAGGSRGWQHPWLLHGHHGWRGRGGRCWGARVGRKGCVHVALPMVAATSGAPQCQVAVWGRPGGRGAQQHCWPLRPLWVMEPKRWGGQWYPNVGTMWSYLCWMPPVVLTRPKWQCVPTRGQGAQRHCWLLWPPWLLGPKQQVLGSPSGSQWVQPYSATSTGCHQWCATAPNGSVWLLGGQGCTEAPQALVVTLVGLPKAAVAGGIQWAPK